MFRKIQESAFFLTRCEKSGHNRLSLRSNKHKRIMMELYTPVELPKKMPPLTHEQRMMMLGSCFAENIGQRLYDQGFCCDVNPFGILYNPLSIAKALERIADGTPYSTDELYADKGCWHSFMHHGSFSHESADKTLDAINRRLEKAHGELGSTQWLMLTWGTAYVYRLKRTGEVVSNCHKRPEREFDRQRITPEEIVERYRTLTHRLLAENPQLHVLITVSPIRHQRDGMHANQLSKATLLLAAEELCNRYPERVHYFPSYEIALDELRDYRFYADDMVHLSPLAVNYIWERFADTFFDQHTRQIAREYADIEKARAHRPFHPESEQYQLFLKQISLKIERFNEKYPKLARKINI